MTVIAHCANSGIGTQNCSIYVEFGAKGPWSVVGYLSSDLR